MKAFWALFALCLLLCALSVPPAGDTALGQEGKPAVGETAVSKDLRGKRYTEIFLIGEKSTEVYNTSRRAERNAGKLRNTKTERFAGAVYG